MSDGSYPSSEMDTDRFAVIAAPRPRRWTNAIIIAVMTLAVAVVAGIVYVAISSAKRMQDAAPPPVATQEPLLQPSSSRSPSRAPLSTTTTTTSSTTSDLKPVSGPAGLTVSLPPSWSVHAGAVASNREATDPGEASRLIRFGGNPGGSGSLFDITARNETRNTAISTGYQRVRLDKIAFGGASEAVDWEFTFTKGGKPTHARGVYWRIGNTDYVVYISSSEASWAESAEIFDSVLASAQPR
ncbi:hypothetical protein [Amycolatopsis sp. NPDC059657]|uniref:hypothetical protein n=1 Tax=Amycolatopsis sp. NPDC059657 TaxID=3346899 RepID=UPI00366CDD0C